MTRIAKALNEPLEIKKQKGKGQSNEYKNQQTNIAKFQGN